MHGYPSSPSAWLIALRRAKKVGSYADNFCAFRAHSISRARSSGTSPPLPTVHETTPERRRPGNRVTPRGGGGTMPRMEPEDSIPALSRRPGQA
jgi:hypothetical protein